MLCESNYRSCFLWMDCFPNIQISTVRWLFGLFLWFHWKFFKLSSKDLPNSWNSIQYKIRWSHQFTAHLCNDKLDPITDINPGYSFDTGSHHFRICNLAFALSASILVSFFYFERNQLTKYLGYFYQKVNFEPIWSSRIWNHCYNPRYDFT